jgi:phosphoglycerate dehydrogenase-like enzyme
MSVVAFIVDKTHPHCKALEQILKDVSFKFMIGNTLEEFGGAENLKDVDLIAPVVFGGGRMDLLTELWPLCPKLRWVHSLAVGVEALVPQMKVLPGGLDVPLTNGKGAYSRVLAEYVLAAMLHFNKHVVRLQQQKKSRTWEKFNMSELHGKTVGFVGFGDIARTTVPYCRAFGMRVTALRQSKNSIGNELADKVYYSGAGAPPEGDQRLDLFKEADYVVCSLPGGADTKHFCGRDEFAAMKETAVFISIGRGTCVDEAALADVLKEGKIGGAALDVFEKEPLPQESPLWACEGLLLSPHNADQTAEYIQNSFDVFLSNRNAFVAPGFAGFDVQVDKVKGY